MVRVRALYLGRDLKNIPNADRDFKLFKIKLTLKEPFTFIRFSDGEMEIIRNERLEINESQVVWRHGVINHSYPVFDSKLFDPETQQDFRLDLLSSAKRKGRNYFKGIPASHNNLVADRDLMVSLNEGLDSNITFADLFLNSNYKKFLREIVPLLHEFSNVVVIGNYRMRPEYENQNWKHVKIPDNFFLRYDDVLRETTEAILNFPEGALVLSSASSLSNVLGAYVDTKRKDLTFLDIGTSLHGHMGMETGIRAYHVHAEPWTPTNVLKKLRFRLKADYKMKW